MGSYENYKDEVTGEVVKFSLKKIEKKNSSFKKSFLGNSFALELRIRDIYV
jgi:hypothetical protein